MIWWLGAWATWDVKSFHFRTENFPHTPASKYFNRNNGPTLLPCSVWPTSSPLIFWSYTGRYFINETACRIKMLKKYSVLTYRVLRFHRWPGLINCGKHKITTTKECLWQGRATRNPRRHLANTQITTRAAVTETLPKRRLVLHAGACAWEHWNKHTTSRVQWTLWLSDLVQNCVPVIFVFTVTLLIPGTLWIFGAAARLHFICFHVERLRRKRRATMRSSHSITTPPCRNLECILLYSERINQCAMSRGSSRISSTVGLFQYTSKMIHCAKLPA